MKFLSAEDRAGLAKFAAMMIVGFIVFSFAMALVSLMGQAGFFHLSSWAHTFG